MRNSATVVRRRAPAQVWASLVLCALAALCTGCTSVGGGGDAPDLSQLVTFLEGNQGSASQTAAQRTAARSSQPSSELLTDDDLYQVYGRVLQNYVDPVDPAVLVQGAVRGFDAGAAAEGILPVASDLVAVASAGQSRDPDAVWAPFAAAYKKFMTKVADRQDVGQVGQATVRGMLQALNDPYSLYLDSRAVQQTQGSGFAGIGIVLARLDPANPPVVREVSVNGPAARGGLRVGDAILAVNGRPTAGDPVSEIGFDIRGIPDTDVVLTVQSRGAAGSRDVTLTRAPVERPSVESRRQNDYEYLRVMTLDSDVAQTVREALVESNRRGDKGWIIDLRGNGGNDLQAVGEIGSMFLGDGMIALDVNRSGQVGVLRGSGTALSPRPPVVVLTDRDTASGAELLTAALHEANLATVIGEKSAGIVGRGVLIPLPDGSQVRLAAEKLITPAGAPINKVGVSPDEQVSSTVDDWIAGRDPQLERAIGRLNELNNRG
ncbi:MAG: carboxyl-terminal processing protease [Chloroflexota bacterium]|nr:carboxyl-terminal processing protease [Chloroflexota bacterium]